MFDISGDFSFVSYVRGWFWVVSGALSWLFSCCVGFGYLGCEVLVAGILLLSCLRLFVDLGLIEVVGWRRSVGLVWCLCVCCWLWLGFDVFNCLYVGCGLGRYFGCGIDLLVALVCGLF